MGSRLSSSGGGGGTTDASALTTGTLALARLSGITTTQLDAAAGITSAQIAALDAAKITTGTLPLGRLSGITTSQLDAAAAITSGQIASLAASKITGTNTLPDGVLSTNVPLLNAANTFTAAQTISASVAGVLAQINNSSTTGAGLVIGSTTVTSAGAGKIAPALALTQTTPATANYGLLSIGSGPWDGSTSGKFASSANGCLIAGNAASGYTGNLIDAQVAGVSKFKVDNGGALTLGGGATITMGGSAPSIQPTGGMLSVICSAAATVVLAVKGFTSQTADLQQWRDSGSNVQFGVTNRGSGGSPIWALKVRATANAESAAQAHVTLGAYSGKGIEVMDDAGSSLGFIPIYA